MGLITRVRKSVHDARIPKRSPHWAGVRHAHLEDFPICAACGCFKDLDVHHIKPFHLFPELELERSNLITLCMWGNHDCHLRIGHGGDFHAYVPGIVADAAWALALYRRKDQPGLAALQAAIRAGRINTKTAPPVSAPGPVSDAGKVPAPVSATGDADSAGSSTAKSNTEE